MAEFEKDAADFKADLVKLGVRILSAGAIAQVVGYSESHVSNLLGGSKRYTPGARTKLGEMIAAKDDGPVVQKHILKPGEIMPGVNVADLDEVDMDDELSAAVRQATQATRTEKRYRVHGRVVRCEEVTFTEVATFASPVAASEYADWLNDRLSLPMEAG